MTLAGGSSPNSGRLSPSLDGPIGEALLLSAPPLLYRLASRPGAFLHYVTNSRDAARADKNIQLTDAAAAGVSADDAIGPAARTKSRKPRRNARAAS